MAPPIFPAPRASQRHRRAAPTILAAGSADAWRAAAGPRHRVTGAAILTAAGEAAVLPEGVWGTRCRGDSEARGSLACRSSSSRDSEAPSRGLGHPVRKQWPTCHAWGTPRTKATPSPPEPRGVHLHCSPRPKCQCPWPGTTGWWEQQALDRLGVAPAAPLWGPGGWPTQQLLSLDTLSRLLVTGPLRVDCDICGGGRLDLWCPVEHLAERAVDRR